MNRTVFKELMKETYNKIIKLNETKGEEYSGSEDVCLNFKKQAQLLNVDPKVIWAVYVNKHWDAIMSHVRTNKIYSEPIEGRIDDVIVYLLLYKALINDQK